MVIIGIEAGEFEGKTGMESPLIADGQTSERKPPVWTVWVMSVLFILLIACIVLIPILLAEGAKSAALQSLSCFEVVGGKVRTNGVLNQHFIASKKCKTAFDKYTEKDEGEYWKEINTIYDTIRAHLIQAPGDTITPNYESMIVFDIDETLLSNLKEIKQAGYGQYTPDAWKKWVSDARAPALPGADQLFKDLRAHGYAVALITGRSEASREATAKNLRASGFGEECTSSSPPNDEICYHKLIMRPEGDHRDAIVYKSEQRAILQSDFDIVGAVGDQWSDFTGMPRPVSVFKLPNPFYYIL